MEDVLKADNGNIFEMDAKDVFRKDFRMKFNIKGVLEIAKYSNNPILEISKIKSNKKNIGLSTFIKPVKKDLLIIYE
jgi:hypothetical protein